MIQTPQESCDPAQKEGITTVGVTLTQSIKDEIDALVDESSDAYAWNMAVFQIMERHYKSTYFRCLNCGCKLEDWLESVIHVCVSCSEVTAFNPILLVDPLLENLINNTAPAIDSFKLPYNAFFINKKFPVDGGFVTGVYVYDYMELFIQQLKHHRKYAKMRELIRERDSMRADPTRCYNDKITLAYICVQKDQLLFSFKSVNMIVNPQNYYPNLSDNSVDLSENSVDILTKRIENEVLSYAVNLSNLINLHCDVNNPKNPKKDLQIIPYKSKNKNGVKIKKIKNMSTIRVSGLIKDYAEQYNAALRTHNRSDLDATHVRGHYRTYYSERYTNMYGKTRWIPPYIRGSDKDLYSKLVKITGS